ncbi:MAG: DUF817 domain-containing protein [Pseudomonadota bacterium]
MNGPAAGQRSRVDEILARLLPAFEKRAEPILGQRLTGALTEFLVFGIKQAWACLFGGLLLLGIIGTGLFWPQDAALKRYDALLIYAIGIQITFLATKLERPQEALVILVFHVTGTAMEVFKTGQGSWTYADQGLLRIGAVPLYSGFMYASVGSYLARVFRVFEFEFTSYPRRRWTVLLAALIYLNFFTHHYTVDIRYVLMAATTALFARTRVHYRVWRWRHQMPMLLGFALVALFIFLAENIATFAGAWVYPDQENGWRMVSWAKFPAWFLLMILSFVLVTLIHPPRQRDAGASAA